MRKTLAKAMKQLPQRPTLSFAYDQGKEMAEHKKLTMDTKRSTSATRTVLG